MTTDAKSKTEEKPKRLTIREIEVLPREEFDRLSKEDRERFFDYMDRENLPSPAEFYGYGAEEYEQWEEPSHRDDDVTALLPFPLGNVVTTPKALSTLEPEEITRALSHHQMGAWGELCRSKDWERNDRSLKEGHRIVSAYHARSWAKILVITEADRSVTTVMMSEEF